MLDVSLIVVEAISLENFTSNSWECTITANNQICINFFFFLCCRAGKIKFLFKIFNKTFQDSLHHCHFTFFHFSTHHLLVELELNIWIFVSFCNLICAFNKILYVFMCQTHQSRVLHWDTFFRQNKSLDSFAYRKEWHYVCRQCCESFVHTWECHVEASYLRDRLLWVPCALELIERDLCFDRWQVPLF